MQLVDLMNLDTLDKKQLIELCNALYELANNKPQPYVLTNGPYIAPTLPSWPSQPWPSDPQITFTTEVK